MQKHKQSSDFWIQFFNDSMLSGFMQSMQTNMQAAFD